MARNLENRRAWARKYYLLHKNDPERNAKKKRYLHEWYLKNKKHHDAYSRKWYKNNPEKVKAMRKRTLDRFRTDPSHHYNNLLYRFRHGTNNRKIPVIITREEFIEWHNSQPQKCFYCGISREEMLKSNDAYQKAAKKLGIDRMDDSLPYIEGNLALACHRCNSIKNNFFTAKEMKEIAEKYVAPKWKLQGLP